MVSILNATSLEMWHDLQRYTRTLIRHSYLGAWDVLQREFDSVEVVNRTVTLREVRLQASISRFRVVGYLRMNFLFSCSGLFASVYSSVG